MKKMLHLWIALIFLLGCSDESGRSEVYPNPDDGQGGNQDQPSDENGDKPSGGGDDKPSGGNQDQPSDENGDKPSGGGDDKPSEEDRIMTEDKFHACEECTPGTPGMCEMDKGEAGKLQYCKWENRAEYDDGYVCYPDWDTSDFIDYPETGTAHYPDGRPCTLFDYYVAEIPGGEYKRDSQTRYEMKPFMMMVTAVDRVMYAACLDRGKCRFFDYIPFNQSGKGDSVNKEECVSVYSTSRLGYYGGLAGRPINCVTHEGAQDFCQWIGGRLPTEAEWEYAALHDGKQVRSVIYPWGNELPEMCVNANYTDPKRDEVCVLGDLYCKTSEFPYSRSTRTDYFAKGMTPLGLSNMAGNIAEFVEDYYVHSDDNYGYFVYVLKGGSAQSPASKLSIKSREYYDESEGRGYGDLQKGDFRNLDSIGFRCVFDYPESSSEDSESLH